jgi:aspartyl-tRNA(Asn)/glutamyl-tRNA(Gln) amidotransferase subunit B
VVQETRLFDPDRGETRPMRSKEDAQDYRYFPDPDLPPLEIAPEWIAAVRASLPELPEALRRRYREERGFTEYEAALLTESREKHAFFEGALAAAPAVPAKLAAHWTNGEMSALLNDRGGDFAAPPLSAQAFARLLERIADGTISAKAGKAVLQAMADGEGDADAVIAKRGLTQISDAGALEAAVDGVLASQAKLVDEFRAGKEKAFNALVGQVMKATQGKANPAQAGEILRRKLGR